MEEADEALDFNLPIEFMINPWAYCFIETLVLIEIYFLQSLLWSIFT